MTEHHPHPHRTTENLQGATLSRLHFSSSPRTSATHQRPPTCNQRPAEMCPRCVGGSKYATRRAKFECAPGTVFDSQMGSCVFSSGSDCIPLVVAPPATPPTTTTNSCTRYQERKGNKI
ncbi:hypothetical protein E2C01_038719 [Portunus trituberculatus]|uniref:Chitin-binding type-2 domain-containing protein n=1 Tax=Portunus trituberculatus TaxID=210409 RepID=A0A5B7FHW3_PORTR|nr:hypothetical protein [Portunus trituberculatus]